MIYVSLFPNITLPLLKNQNMAKITVQTTDVTILKINDTDYISLTDIAKYKTTDANTVIANWLRNRMTIEYLGLWEILYNPHFKPLEFEGFRKRSRFKCIHSFSLKMDRNDLCYWTHIQIRKIWRHFCSQRYCFQICKLDFC